MDLNADQREEKSGFTLVEMIIVLALFATLMMGLLGMLLTVYHFTNSTEYTVSYKTQEDRVRNFIANMIRQNQVAGAIEAYGSSGVQDHLSVKLADGSGEYAHFLMQDRMLYMYVGREKEKYSLTQNEIDQHSMSLARDMKSIQFNMTTDDATGNRLLHIEQVGERTVRGLGELGVSTRTNAFDYKINIYTR